MPDQHSKPTVSRQGSVTLNGESIGLIYRNGSAWMADDGGADLAGGRRPSFPSRAEAVAWLVERATA
jgi:hypothetical protein